MGPAGHTPPTFLMLCNPVCRVPYKRQGTLSVPLAFVCSSTKNVKLRYGARPTDEHLERQ